MKQITVCAFDRDNRFRFNFTIEPIMEIQGDLFATEAYEAAIVKKAAKEIIESIKNSRAATSHGAHFKRIKTLRYDGKYGSKEIRL